MCLKAQKHKSTNKYNKVTVKIQNSYLWEKDLGGDLSKWVIPDIL